MRSIMAKAISYMKPDIDPNTRLYVPFNEGVGDPKDYSNYNNPTTNTDVLWGIGINGNAGVFNGATSILSMGHGTWLDLVDALTISMNVKPEEVIGSNRAFIYKYGLPNAYRTYQVGLTIGLHINAQSIYTGNLLGIGIKTRVAFSYDKSLASDNLKVFADGIQKAQADLQQDITINTVDLSIGCGPPTYFFKGTINQSILRALAESPAQIAADCYEVCN